MALLNHRFVYFDETKRGHKDSNVYHVPIALEGRNVVATIDGTRFPLQVRDS